MEHSVRTTLAAIVAIASACLAAPTVYAEPDSSGLKEDLAPGVILGREVNTMVLPQFIKPDPGATSRRPPKPTTLLQVDAQLGETSDMLFRVQAKRKQFVYFEFRF